MLLPDLEECAKKHAEEVCWTLQIMIGLGELEIDNQGWRNMIARSLWPWSMIRTGDFPNADEVTAEDVAELAKLRG